jgi:hypothetical protein
MMRIGVNCILRTAVSRLFYSANIPLNCISRFFIKSSFSIKIGNSLNGCSYKSFWGKIFKEISLRGILKPYYALFYSFKNIFFKCFDKFILVIEIYFLNYNPVKIVFLNALNPFYLFRRIAA